MDEHEKYMDEQMVRQIGVMLSTMQETLVTIQSMASTVNLCMVNLNNMIHLLDVPYPDTDNFLGGSM